MTNTHCRSTNFDYPSYHVDTKEDLFCHYVETFVLFISIHAMFVVLLSIFVVYFVLFYVTIYSVVSCVVNYINII